MDLVVLTDTSYQSSAEFSEAINSMWKFYQQSMMCIVFLSDLQFRAPFRFRTDIRWFDRGPYIELHRSFDDCWPTGYSLLALLQDGITGVNDTGPSVLL